MVDWVMGKGKVIVEIKKKGLSLLEVELESGGRGSKVEYIVGRI